MGVIGWVPDFSIFPFSHRLDWTLPVSLPRQSEHAGLSRDANVWSFWDLAGLHPPMPVVIRRESLLL